MPRPRSSRAGGGFAGESPGRHDGESDERCQHDERTPKEERCARTPNREEASCGQWTYDSSEPRGTLCKTQRFALPGWWAGK